MTDRLPVENPAVRRIAAALGLTVTTDQLGKDTAETDTGIMIESRYFVGETLIERKRGIDVLGFGSRDWWVDGEKFLGPSEAFIAIARARSAR